MRVAASSRLHGITGRIAILFTISLLSLYAKGQGAYGWEDFVSELAMDGDMDDDSEDWELYMEDLKLIHDNPMNINTATVDDLSRLPFLDGNQIEEIHAYIYLHGQMQTLGELRLLRLMDEKTMERMHLFTYARDTSKDATARNVFRNMKSDFSTRMDIPLYYKRGFMVRDGYAGDPLYHRIRYEYGNSRHFKAGLRVEKDAGERYYDSYGAYVSLKDVGIVRNAVAGDYRIGFGEGLVVGGSLWHSKATPAMTPQGGIRPMRGMDETDFLRGAAVTLRLGRKTEVSVFGSCRQRDATLNKEGDVQTLVSGGYHRTRLEREKKHNVAATFSGANVTWKSDGLHFGLTGSLQSFSRRLAPGDALYRAYYPEGRLFGAVGLSYGYRKYNIIAAGETAYSTGRNGVATLNRMAWNVNQRYTLSVIQRFYAKEYHSFQARAFGEGSTVQNENGVMLHLSSAPATGWQLMAYADFFYQQWPRYRISHSSAGQDFVAEARRSIGYGQYLTARYQLKRKETYGGMEAHNRVKLQWTATWPGAWKCHTTALLHEVGGQWGWGVQQYASCAIRKPDLRISLVAGYFDTDDYRCRIYFYEPSLYSSVSHGQFYGRGITGSLVARWTSRDGRWMVECKYRTCRYFDRDTQGSGLDTVYSPWRNDISAQLRVKI